MWLTKKIKTLNLKVSKSILALNSGNHKNIFFWNWLDFIKNKDYEFSDLSKNINWKIFSKTDKLYTKIFSEEKKINVLFLVDSSSSVFLDWKKELFEEIFYILALNCQKNNDNFWILFFWNEENFLIEQKTDFWNILKFFEYFDKIEKGKKIDEKRLEKIFESLNKKNIKNNLIFVLTDWILTEKNKNLEILWLKNDIIFINIFNFFENNLSNLTEKNFSSWESFLDISFDKKKVEEFNNLRKEKIQNFKNILQKSKIWYIYIDTKKDFLKEILAYFK